MASDAITRCYQAGLGILSWLVVASGHQKQPGFRNLADALHGSFRVHVQDRPRQPDEVYNSAQMRGTF
jgi:hypothetical protein